MHQTSGMCAAMCACNHMHQMEKTERGVVFLMGCGGGVDTSTHTMLVKKEVTQSEVKPVETIKNPQSFQETSHLHKEAFPSHKLQDRPYE